MPATVRRGDRGDDVRLCQQRLTEHGYPATADGIFGSGTESKVMAFQRVGGLGADGIVGPNTWTALLADPVVHEPVPPAPLPLILQRIRDLGHEIMWQGDYHLNLFGIRSSVRKANSFDDTIGCAYTEQGLWRVHYWPGTTDPGTYWLENPSRVEGTAILVPGQYTAWKIGLHGSYEALSQEIGTVKVYRDNNKNDILDHDPATIQEGWYGINIHRSSTSGESTEVGQWSAGCQVHARLDGFNEMMDLARKQVDRLGIHEFTYTLIDED